MEGCKVHVCSSSLFLRDGSLRRWSCIGQQSMRICSHSHQQLLQVECNIKSSPIGLYLPLNALACVREKSIIRLHRGNRDQVAYNVNHTMRESQRDRVALVASIGTGTFPAEDLGSTDAQQFLFFGKHWFKSKTGLFQTVENLITLLTKAVRQQIVF